MLRRIGTVLRQQAYAGEVSFEDWDTRIDQAKAVLDQARTREAFTEAVNDVLKGYKISHLLLMENQLDPVQRPNFRGYGFQYKILEGRVRLANVIPDSPAAQIGLRRGDTLLEVNGGDPLKAKLTFCGEPLQLRVKRGNHTLAWTLNRSSVEAYVRAKGGPGSPESMARTKGMKVDFMSRRGPDRYGGPLVALCDSGSASCAEMLLAALQDLKRANQEAPTNILPFRLEQWLLANGTGKDAFWVEACCQSVWPSRSRFQTGLALTRI